jgi:serine/threonine protein kinase/WD40 repeat protein
MSDKIPCPQADDLYRFVLGQMTDAEAEHLERHLSWCNSCVTMVQGLEASDALVEAVQAGVRGPPDIEIGADESLIARLCGLRQSAAGSPAEDTSEEIEISPAAVETPTPGGAGPVGDNTQVTYDFLAPAQGPGEIGRLGPYRVVKVLGAGGMGVVFLSEDPSLKRPVALKVIRPALAARPITRQRFQQEAQAAAAVKHDHIATIYYVGEDRGVPFLAMEYLEGETLEDRLRRDGELPIAEAVRVGREIAEGLAAAHERGLIHRDVKPGNIWLEAPRVRVKLLDFGLAQLPEADAALGQSDMPPGIVAPPVEAKSQVHARLTPSDMILGTPGYMAPELARRGAAVDARCDLFSLGCVLYRMTTGEEPFRGTTAMDTLVAVVHDNPKPPRELNPDVPPALSHLVMRLLAKDPAMRPPSAATLITDLKLGAEAPRPTRSEDSGRKKHRFRLLVAGLAVSGLAALVVILLFARGVIRHRDKPEEMLAEEALPLEEILRLEDEGAISDVAFSPDGKQALTCSYKMVSLWDLTTGEKVRSFTGHNEHVWCLAFSPDGHQAISAGGGLEKKDGKLVMGEDFDIRLWDVNSGNEIKRFQGHTNRVLRGLAFAPGGRQFLSGAYDKTLRMWDVQTGKQVRLFDKQEAGVMKMALSQDGGKALLAGNNGIVWLWDLDKDEFLRRLEGHWGSAGGVAFSPDGQKAFSASRDTTVRLWDVRTGRQLRSFAGHQTGVNCLAVSPDGQRILTGTGTRVMDRDGRNMPAGWDYRVRLWDVDSGREIARFEGHTKSITAVAFSPDGRFALSGSSDCSVRLLRVPEPDQRPRPPLPPDGPKPSRPTWPAELLLQGEVPAPDLDRIKPLYDDQFKDPRTGFKSTNAYSEVGYDGGKLYLQRTPLQRTPLAPAVRPAPPIYKDCPWGRFAHFACEVTGRLVEGEAGLWGLVLEGGKLRQVLREADANVVFIRFSGDGQLEVSLGAERAGWPKTITHKAIKKKDDWNKLLVVVRGRQLELYVNSVAVCDPLVVDYDFTPAWLNLYADAAPGPADRPARLAELSRIRICPAEKIPPPEARGATLKE